MTLHSLVILLACSASTISFGATEQPNVVFVLADDVGYGDLGSTGHPYAKTTEIDRLAAEGAIFHRFYVAGATCSPSRTGIMTGRFPATFEKYPAGFGFSGAITLTDILKEAGYRIGHFGKWHMGPDQKAGTYGIDTIEVLGSDRSDPRGRDAVILDAALDFIASNRAGPFYLNIWLLATHNPVKPPKALANEFSGVDAEIANFPNPDMEEYLKGYERAGGELKQGMRNYLGDVLQIDRQVGRLLKAIDELGLRDDTIVVFTSDNGPAGYQITKKQKNRARLAFHPNMLGSAGPLRERKHSFYDGGIRQPLIVRWPGRIKEGRVDRTTVLAGVDWLPTLCKIAGAECDAAQFDGEDASDIWLGEARKRQKDLFWKASHRGSRLAMLRENWKLHLRRGNNVELYDLAADPGERKDLAASFPEIADRLADDLRHWNSGLPKQYLKIDKK